jgi:TRAP-type C4-dicarboxylate transport system permease small subunit
VTTRVLDVFFRLCALAAVVLMVVGIAGVMIAQVIGRELGLALPGGDDIVAFSTAASAFLGLAHTFRNGEMIRVGLLLGVASPRTRDALNAFCLTVGVVVTGYIAWHAAAMVVETYEIGEMAPGLLRIPLWLPQAAMALGVLALCLALAEDLLRVLRRERPLHEKIAEERRGRGEIVGEV